jgi:5-(carboxyamino)imidazole ribonucleotide synthase
LLANEMAPRVHNSGHWTQNGSITSQFENHLRAIQGLPLGSTKAIKPTCMINIIGQMGDTQHILALEGVHLHLYGKSERPGRKLGHINVVADDLTNLIKQVRLVSQHLPNAPEPKFTCVAV